MPRRNLDGLDTLGDRERSDLQDAAERAQSHKINLLIQQGFRQLLFPMNTQEQIEEFRRVQGILADPDIDSHIVPHADGMLVYVKPEVIRLLQVRSDVRMVMSGQGEPVSE